MKNKQSNIAPIAIFFAIMIVLHLLTSIIFNLLPMPIKPTIVHVPVIIASIIYGPRIGAWLGFLMGIISVVNSTVVLLPTSYLFSPFVPNGNIYSLIIAIVPRILIGITPYFVYKFMKNRTGLILAGAVGSATNTIFVLGGIFILFSGIYQGNIQALLAVVLSANSIAELLISALLTMSIVPALEKIRK
ncbi:ECF transporter S component [Streptococcus massiliensis]|uniref:Membrane protein n=1 Tax=Streptococcus massiliensis TaxID=313439 RepID=A0A380KX88_9STRE|nr:ECF transporter S component [Streptococcus massiliensis]SUN75889.1 membrane protein [Streptococcus massiliensis]